MKHIVIVIDSLVGGGAEKVMLTLASALQQLGQQVAILSLGNGCDYNIPEGINVFHLFDHKAKKVDRFWTIKSSVAKLQYWFKQYQAEQGVCDIVLSNLDRSNNLLANSDIRPVYYIVHNSIQEELARQKKLGFGAYLYLKRSKKNLSGKRLITVSKGLQQEISNLDFIQPKTIQTIYNPFNIEKIKALATQENHDIPNEPYIIHVGRLAKQKRHDILFAAFKELTSHHKLVLLCNNISKAKKLAQKHGVLERVIFPGFQTNPYAWIKNADLLVLSSDYEGFPSVLNEAIALGTKVVSTRCAHGPDEIMTDELSPFLVPRRDPQALSQAMKNALVSDIDVSRAEILSKISHLDVAKQYLALARS